MRGGRMITQDCKKCGCAFGTYPSRIRVGRGMFCSHACSASYTMKGNGRAVGSKGWVGKRHTLESKGKNRAAHVGKRASVGTEFKPGLRPWNKGIPFAAVAGDRHPSKRPEVALAISRAKAGKPNLKIRGALNHRWKGGITPENHAIRSSMEYAAWRTAVFIRDDYTCQSCGVRGGRLNADHIKRFADFHELRLDVANGRTLCEGCHRKTETYGNRPQNAATGKWRCVANA